MIKKIFNRFDDYHLYAVVLLIFVLLTHGYFALTHVSFSQDQARDLFIVQNLIDSEKYVVSYGPKTSIGDFTVFPFYYQLFLIVQLLIDHPLTMYLVVTIIESFTPVILFFLLSLFFKKKIAWISAFLYSFFYSVITFSTSAWSPNLVPFFITTTLCCWMYFLIKNKNLYLLLSVITLGLAIHLHFQVLLLLPFSLIMFFISLRRSKKAIKYWLLGALLVSITFLPYLITEMKSGWPNTLSILQFYTFEHVHYFDRVTKPQYILSFFPGLIERIMFGNELPYLIFGRALFFIGMTILTTLSYKQKKFRYLFLYFIVLFISLRLFKGDKHDYYLFPFFILPAVLIASVLQKIGKYYLPLSLILVFILGFSFNRPHHNQVEAIYSSTKVLVDKLPKDQLIHFIFYDLDEANTYLYALSQLDELTFDRNSSILLEICQNKKQCSGHLIPWCINNREQITYSTLIKWDNNYEEIEKIFTSTGLFARLGKLEFEQEKVFPPFNKEMSTRKDLLVTEIN